VLPEGRRYGASEGSEFIRRHIIPVPGAFDDFAAGGSHD
jgi:hypothetical protein